MAAPGIRPASFGDGQGDFQPKCKDILTIDRVGNSIQAAGEDRVRQKIAHPKTCHSKGRPVSALASRPPWRAERRSTFNAKKLSAFAASVNQTIRKSCLTFRGGGL